MSDTPMFCKRCGAPYFKDSPTPGYCWECHRCTTSNTLPAVPISQVTEAAVKHLMEINARRAARLTEECSRCHQKYEHLYRGTLCFYCGGEDNRRAAARTKALEESGISFRHARFQTWEELAATPNMPPEYGRTLEIVEEFTQIGAAVLALIGNRGTGKSQIAAVAVRDVIVSGHTAKYATAIGITTDLKRRFGNKERTNPEGDWLKQWLRPHLLCVDEITELQAGDYSRSMFVRLIDERYAACSPTILIGNVTPEQYAQCVGSSIADRTNEGGLRNCTWPSFRQAT
jgi:DNA replication protein DnaC